MAWHEGKPEYRSSPNSKEVRENFAYLKALADLLSGAGVTEEELSQLHESGVVKADLEKLHDITSSATEINQLHESGVVKADLVKINTIGKIKARAYRRNAQNIGEETTKILIDTVNFDPEGVVSITNSRIIPNLPGYYMVIGNIQVSYVQAHHGVKALICKNGTPRTNGTLIRQSDIGAASSTASDLIYMDGATDYLELYAYSSDNVSLALYRESSRSNYISVIGPF